jgi:hypothetical protein
MIEDLQADDVAKTPDESTILTLIQDELSRCIGLDADSDLNAARGKAMEYIQGVMVDLPPAPNRSNAVTTDVRDAIETVLPDLIEVLANDGVVEFPATGADDEEQAAIETEFVRSVVFDDNAGFKAIQDATRDALSIRLGVIKVWSERYETRQEEDQAGVPMGSAAMLEAQGVTIEDYAQVDGLETFKAVKVSGKGKVCVASWPPEDFGYSRDAENIAEATYVVARERVRAFELLARGYDAELVAQLDASGAINDIMDKVRDVAASQSYETHQGGIGNHRIVVVLEHYIRILGDDGTVVIQRVVTNADATILLDQGTVTDIPFAIGTPYPMPHRVMGNSIPDMTMDVQRVRSTLLRMGLDSGYFALNQRPVVSDQGQNEHTLNDVLYNAPGAPIRVKTQDGVSYPPSQGVSFDVFGAYEILAAMIENRTGIIRAANGLNSDALHDTMGGQEVLNAASQKRTRLMARNLAETMIAPMFRLVHAACREVIKEPVIKKLSSTWRDDIVPAKWRARGDVTVDVGVGSGGRVEDMAYSREILQIQERLAQNGFGGTMVTPSSIHAAVNRLVRTFGVKNVESLFPDPAKAPPAPTGEGEQDPAVAAASAELEMKRQEAAAKIQIMREDAQIKAQLAREKSQNEMILAREKMAMEANLRREETRMRIEAGLMTQTPINIPVNRPGGDLSA